MVALRNLACPGKLSKWRLLDEPALKNVFFNNVGGCVCAAQEAQAMENKWGDLGAKGAIAHAC